MRVCKLLNICHVTYIIVVWLSHGCHVPTMFEMWYLAMDHHGRACPCQEGIGAQTYFL